MERRLKNHDRLHLEELGGIETRTKAEKEQVVREK